MSTDPTISEYAQFLADATDATIFLKHTGQPHAIDDVDVFLRDTGWDGRRYPLGYFTIATVPRTDTSPNQGD